MSSIDPIQFTKGGEISENALRQLNELIEAGPGEDASDEEIDAYMAKAMKIEGAADMIQQFSEQMKDGGVLAEVLKTEAANEPFAQLNSAARLIYLVEKEGRSIRMSLPTDASFYELHAAITEAFEIGLKEKEGHRFELREDGEVEVVFSEKDYGNSYCEKSNKVLDIYEAGVSVVHYLNDGEYRVKIEAMAAAGEEGTSLGMTPHLHSH
ncbi:hypothetical protein N9224_00440 [Akkermansiaceae bacterium]|nr:hypothetical protein [Akkermansiaceae bacterium]MDB4500632.1 hypothetical protein [Akkermansiaceae bacterium]